MSPLKPGVGVAPLETLKTMRGLDFLNAMIDGRLPTPPIADALGFRLAEVAEGFALFTVTPEFRHYNPIGVVHGGLAATLLDSCMGCAVHTHTEAGTGYATLELKVNMVRPITDKSGPLRAEGRTLYVGRRSATAEGKLVDAKGTLLAHGTTTCLMFPF